MHRTAQVTTRNPDTDLLSTVREQVRPPRTERRMLEPSSMGEMAWKPPWSPAASVQQGQEAADKEEWDPGGGPGNQLTASTKAAFPAGRLTLPSQSRQEKQGGCHVGRLSSGHLDQPSPLAIYLWREIYMRGTNLSPSNPRPPLQHERAPGRATKPLYNQLQEGAKPLIDRPARLTEARGVRRAC